MPGSKPLPGSAVYGDNRPEPAIPGRNANGENAELVVHRDEKGDPKEAV